MKLQKPEVYAYSADNHIEFHKQTELICIKFKEVIDDNDMLSIYHDKVVQEDNTYKWMRKSDFTKKKLETDSKRDAAYTGITNIVRLNLHHFDPALRDNAQHIQNLLGNYGDVVRMNYDGETASIDSIVARLKSNEYILAAKNLGLESWITELENQNTLFKIYVEDSIQEQLNKPSISARNARRETNDALNNITNRVTALINLNGPDNYTAFVHEFNINVNHYNVIVHEHYGRLHVKTDIAPAIIAPIETQQYTGKPVYVIPTVSIVKKEKDGTETIVELVFSENFIVNYKNNVAPGTATLIITGIGKYTGEVVTTFNIDAIDSK